VLYVDATETKADVTRFERDVRFGQSVRAIQINECFEGWMCEVMVRCLFSSDQVRICSVCKSL